MILKNAEILNSEFEFEKTDLEISGGKFSFLGKTDKEGMDMSGKYIVPGLVEMHMHGATGYELTDRKEETIEAIAGFMLKNGVTSFAPTVAAQNFDDMLNACRMIRKYAEAGEKYAKIAGIYMEGPYLAGKFRGGMLEEDFRKPSADELRMINEISGGRIKLMAVAPEIDGAIEFIKEVKDEIKISIGHTDSTYDVAKKAIEAGASNLTHTFNAMRAYNHREPGVLGAAFTSDITCECISDGIHLHPATVILIYKLVGEDRMILISDSMRGAGLPDGVYTTAGRKVTVKDGKATRDDGTIAGSSFTLFRCVKKAIEFGIPAEKAFKCATINPAKVMGTDGIVGSIKEGKCADFLVLDKDYNLCEVYKNGEKIDV